MVKHAISEACRLGMEVDLPPGGGWRIGGTFLPDSAAGAKLYIKKSEATSVYTVENSPSGELVKRACPGGEGKAFNPFSRTSLQAIIEHFTSSFKDLKIRAQFHDSWEYESNSCSELLDHFRKTRL